MGDENVSEPGFYQDRAEQVVDDVEIRASMLVD